MHDTSQRSPSWMPKVVKEAGISLVGSVVGTALNYAVLATVTRYLNPSEFGMFAVAQSVIAVSIVFVLVGTPRALDKFIPHYEAGREPGRARGLILSILRLVSWTAIVVAVALLGLSRSLATSVFGNPELVKALRLMVISIPALAWIEIVAMSFAGFKELRYRVYTHQLAMPLLKIAFAVLILSFGHGLDGWIWAYLASLAVTSAFALSLFRVRIWNRLRESPVLTVPMREIMSYCWPLSVNALLVMLLGHVGILLLGAFRPEAEAGVYRVYVYVVMVLSLAKTAFAQIYKPVSAGLAAADDRNENRELHRRVSKWMLMTAGFMGLVILLLGREILGILVPPEYLVSASALVVLAGARTLAAALGPQGAVLEAFGNTRFSMLNAILMLGLNVGLGRLLIPEHGVLGAAAALAVALTAVTGAELLEVYVLHRLHPFGSAYVRALAVVLGAGVVVYLIKMAWGGGGALRVSVLTLALAGLLVAGFRLTGALDEGDDAVIRRVVEKVRGRVVVDR